jgi:hypothetical protein
MPYNAESYRAAGRAAATAAAALENLRLATVYASLRLHELAQVNHHALVAEDGEAVHLAAQGHLKTFRNHHLNALRAAIAAVVAADQTLSPLIDDLIEPDPQPQESPE